MSLDIQAVSYLLGVGGLLTIVFNVYNSFRNPQIKGDQEVGNLKEDFKALKSVVGEIKEKHLALVETNIKELSGSVHGLALNVTRLTTIIDERIPKTSK